MRKTLPARARPVLHRAADPCDETLSDYPAAQQPDWPDRTEVADVRDTLSEREDVVGPAEVLQLRSLLARAAEGEFCVLQAGDCAEDPADTGVRAVARKIGMLDTLAEIMRVGSGRPVLEVGRIAGQYAKPRSQNVENVDGHELPVYRGPIVNSPEPTAEARRPDPGRILDAHEAALGVRASIGRLGRGTGADPAGRIWTSHEALLLDYEVPLVRRMPGGRSYLASTHWPWIGERTRRSDGAHVHLLSTVVNPVAAKVSAKAPIEDVLKLCEQLDPYRTPGRLTLIPRFGAARIGELAPLVRAVRDAGHPVLWLCDPMHGNTVVADDGLKVRWLEDIMNELRQFVRIVTGEGGACAGLHMEASPSEISECHGAGITASRGPGYTTLCDPRLNLTQAVALTAHWQPEAAHELRTELAS
ncbi:3-deoxy-7-phosphoheptulonate synthase [Amycolatopsis sp. NPDC088138]|uniref:3-deoxy-7-phosphoheptulonate synthase n=1 Tax=Amycolatopsis sp. NPDC088138 TaxID=3363938 RepID=UPI00380118CD